MFSDDFEVFLLGLGHSGLATGLFFQRQGIVLAGWDDEEKVRNRALDLGLCVIPHPCPKKFLYIVVSPGIAASRLEPFHTLCASGKAMMTCDLGLFLILFPQAKVLGITGTNGKSTTCSLIAHVLRVQNIPHQLAGNVGVPIFSVASHHHQNVWYVLEFSSYQLELCTHHAWQIEVGGVLNVTPHHLERHGTLKIYSTIKRSLLEHSRHGVLDISGPYTQEMELQLQKTSLMRLKSGKGRDSAHQEEENTSCIYYTSHSLTHGNHRIVFSNEERFHSFAFQQNVAMTYGVLRHVPGALIDFPQTLERFQELPHRQNCFAIHHKVYYVDDSKATTPEACAQALMRWSFPIFWIAGGVKQQDDLSVLEPALYKVKQAFLYGQSARRFQEFLEPRGVSCHRFDAMKDAVCAAWNAAQFYENVVVLCSPGCPSFDQFLNFVQRGKAFQACIQQLITLKSQHAPLSVLE